MLESKETFGSDSAIINNELGALQLRSLYGAQKYVWLSMRRLSMIIDQSTWMSAIIIVVVSKCLACTRVVAEE